MRVAAQSWRRHARRLVQPQLWISLAAGCWLLTGVAAWQRHSAHVPLDIPSVSSAVKGVSVEGSRPAVDCAVVPCIALTFDDGPDARVTPATLDVLARHRARATFFLVGREVAGQEDVVRRIYREGHQIGNHSWNHPDLTTLSPDAIRWQMASTQTAIAASGVPPPTVFRPPYGAVNPAVRAQVPLPIIRWDVDTQDWLTKDPARVIEHLRHDVTPGSIVLLHDTYDAVPQALEAVLPELQARYQLVTVSDLLALSPGDQGHYFDR